VPPAEVNSSLGETTVEVVLAPLREHPEHSALLCDIDGTIAPIVARADEASVPRRARELLTDLNRRYAFVGCLSGRRAADARRVVGIGSIAYVGNHGLEYLRPGAQRANTVPALSSHARDVREFANKTYSRALRNIGIRLEDKDSIWSFDWREAGDEGAATKVLKAIATSAEQEGLIAHWGRKVLEIRPPMDVDKGTALATMLKEADVEAAFYGGDDTTDLDAFRKLRELRSDGRLKHTVAVGVRSEEGPAEITSEADLVVEGTGGFLELLAML
jgi:trehalose 6-phosphate phosphatase